MLRWQGLYWSYHQRWQHRHCRVRHLKRHTRSIASQAAGDADAVADLAGGRKRPGNVCRRKTSRSNAAAPHHPNDARRKTDADPPQLFSGDSHGALVRTSCRLAGRSQFVWMSRQTTSLPRQVGDQTQGLVPICTGLIPKEEETAKAKAKVIWNDQTANFGVQKVPPICAKNRARLHSVG